MYYDDGTEALDMIQCHQRVDGVHSSAAGGADDGAFCVWGMLVKSFGAGMLGMVRGGNGPPLDNLK